MTILKPSVSLGLWGFRDFNQKELAVVAVDPAFPSKPFFGVSCDQGAITGLSRTWNISSSVGGRVRIEARTSDGGTWDWVELIFTGAPSSSGSENDKKMVLEAVHSGAILGARSQLTAVCTTGFLETPKGNLTLAGPMFGVLAALSQNSTITLLSLMRYAEGPHGKVQPDGSAVCSAMDIQQFGRFRLNLIRGENVDDTIAGTAAVLAALPKGMYAVGLTRPSPFPQGPPMPDNDVFLPVKTHADIYKVGFPLQNPTAQFRNPDAASAINAALSMNPSARINRMFEDGPDHMHLEVIS